MNLWDFDGTIYDGESIMDFFLFCLGRKKSLVRYLPVMAGTLVMYKMGLASVDRLMKAANFLPAVRKRYKVDIEEWAKDFWEKNERKLKPEILARLGKDDLITTFSPGFFIDIILPKLKVGGAICSDFDTKTGEVLFANFGENKVISFKKKYPGARIENFYSDSKADKPLMRMAKHAFLVKGSRVTQIK